MRQVPSDRIRAAGYRSVLQENLYYPLQVFDSKLPALRDRTGDILPLSAAFLEGNSAGCWVLRRARLTRDAQNALLQYRRRGNVRELRNALERAAILCEARPHHRDHLSLDREGPAGQRMARATTNVNEIERRT